MLRSGLGQFNHSTSSPQPSPPQACGEEGEDKVSEILGRAVDASRRRIALANQPVPGRSCGGARMRLHGNESATRIGGD